MTLAEKVAQLGSVWEVQNEAGPDVAPMSGELNSGAPSFADLTAHGLGHLTRVFGSTPITAGDGARLLKAKQDQVRHGNRLGIPAIAHEECLTGFTAYGATVYPTALAWGATFDEALIESMASAIGADMAAVEIHQGLSPVLDVVRDLRWGRVEETMGEDPYLVSLLGSAYVRGLQSAGIVATLKHFAGYAASQGARNHAPVSIGRRELADTVLPPFEMAVRDAGVKSVMNSYADLDGMPPVVDHALLTGLLRDSWGFDGTIVSDYYAILFAQQMHAVAADRAGAARLALTAGVDVELPQTDTFSTLVASVQRGELDSALIDQAVRRVLSHKVELGLLDADYSPTADEERVLDSAHNRKIARDLAAASLILLSNDGTLPLTSAPAEIALIGPSMDDPRVLMGCYAFPNHVLSDEQRAEGYGLPIPTLREALEAEFVGSVFTHTAGCTIPSAKESAAGDLTDESAQMADAAALAAQADVAIVAVGDIAGLFGEGTSGEGCDAPHLKLPGQQRQLVEAVLTTGTPVILIVVSGRPYALDGLADQAAAVIQSFFPGVEGAAALAQVVSGKTNPSGQLPVSVPASAFGGQSSYRTPSLGRNEWGISNIDTAPAFPFGHGLSYTTIDYLSIEASHATMASDRSVDVQITLRNSGSRPADETVQLYASDLVGQVARPLVELIGFHKVTLQPGESTTVRFAAHTDRLSFTGADYQRTVEPGEVIFRAGPSSADLPLQTSVMVTGETRKIPGARVMRTPGTVLD